MATPATAAVEPSADAAAAGGGAVATTAAAGGGGGDVGPSLWEWLAPARVPPTDATYAEYRPFFAVTRHILGAELVDRNKVLLAAAPVVVDTYLGLLAPSLGPTTTGGVLPGGAHKERP